jgi:hypothetical protein
VEHRLDAQPPACTSGTSFIAERRARRPLAVPATFFGKKVMFVSTIVSAVEKFLSAQANVRWGG